MMKRPYPRDTILSARDLLHAQGHSRNTVKCAEYVNSPLWQQAIAATQERGTA